MIDERTPGEIPRYGYVTRLNHWVVALCFLLLAFSGLALFHPALFWLTALFGGGPWTRILHPFIGLVWVVSFALLAAKVWRDNFAEPGDREWLRRIGDVLDQREEDLPAIGKYNAGQKILFWVIVVCLLGLLATGLCMWRAYFSLPVQVVRIASLLHAFIAVVLICSIIVHIYAAYWVKGSIRAMTQGSVSYGWAWKHHRAWFREMISGRR